MTAIKKEGNNKSKPYRIVSIKFRVKQGADIAGIRKLERFFQQQADVEGARRFERELVRRFLLFQQLTRDAVRDAARDATRENDVERTNNSQNQNQQKGWHDAAKHEPIRRKMIAKIMITLHNKKPHAPKQMKKRLPLVSKRLELYMYKNAPSLEAYLDMTTLPVRMGEFATLVLERARLREALFYAQMNSWNKTV